MSRPRGFTLIEVLVALAIVAIGMAAVLGALTASANTVSNRATAALPLAPCWVVTTTWKPSGSSM